MELSNANLPEVLAVHSAQAWLLDGLVATECSLWRMHEGELVLDDHGRWRSTEQARTLRLGFEPSPPWALGRSADRVQASEARMSVPRTAWLALLLLPALAVGGWRWRQLSG